MSVEEAIAELEANPRAVRFRRLAWICEAFFGRPRVNGSHHVFKTPWPGDPRVNIQRDRSARAKPYQVEQVLAALRKLQSLEEEGG